MIGEKFASAYQRGFESTVRFLVSRGVQQDSAAEAAQAAWVRGWERRDQLRNEGLLLPWVNSIALNLYRGHYRKEQRLETLIDKRGKSVAIDLAAIDIAKILNACRPSDRMLFEQWMRGVTTAEMAQQSGVTETAIRIRFLRARRCARSAVDRNYSEPGRRADTVADKRVAA